MALFTASQNYVLNARLRRPITWFDATIDPLIICWLWALVTPAIFLLAERFRIERTHAVRNLLVHLLASLSLSLILKIAQASLLWFFISRFKGSPLSFDRILTDYYSFFDYWIVLYGLILLGHHSSDFYRRYRQNELKASQLETQLAQAQLAALRSQLNPHFLFNTLHAISALMYKDVRAANRMVSQLSDLFRMTLETSGTQQVRLKQELDFIQRYLEIQRARFSDRLQVRFSVDEETLDAMVPSFILQPLVENAVRHGIAPRVEAGELEIVARREGDRLLLKVCDNGRGFPSEDVLGRGKHGFGLASTRERLRRLYNGSHLFALLNAPGGGAVVRVEIPFVLADSPAAPEAAEVPGEIIGMDSGEAEAELVPSVFQGHSGGVKAGT